MFPIDEFLMTSVVTGGFTYAVTAEVQSTSEDASDFSFIALATDDEGNYHPLSVKDEEGQEVEVASGVLQEIGSSSFKFFISVPDEVTFVTIRGESQQQQKNIYVVGDLEIEPLERLQSFSPVENFTYEHSVQNGCKLDISASIKGSIDSNKSALIEVIALDDKGNRLDIPGWRPVSKVYKEFFYLPGLKEESKQSRVSVDLTDLPVTKVVLNGHLWEDKKAAISVVIEQVEDDSQSFNQVLQDGTLAPLDTENFNVSIVIPQGAHDAELIIPIESENQGDEAKTPLGITFVDKAGKELIPATGLSISPVFGAFSYLREKYTHTGEWDKITIPDRAHRMELKGHFWRGHAAKITQLPKIIWRKENALKELQRFLQELPADNKGVIVVDTTAPPVGDESRALRPNNLTREYAKLGYGVVFFAFGGIQDQSSRPLKNVIQLDRVHFDDVIHHLANADFNGSRTYICSSFGSLAAVCTTDYLKSHGWNCVYEVRDDMEEFNRVGYSKWYTPELERRMVKSADRIVTVSPALKQKMNSLDPGSHHKISVVPNAVRPEIVQRNESLRDVTHWNNRPLKVGYVGHLTSSWFDWRPVIAAAQQLPHIDFEIIGHGMPKGLHLPANMKYLGAKTHDELPEIVGEWRVGLIPFQLSPLTRGVDPNKLFEYVAWGLRTVSAPMGSVDTAPSTAVYRSAEQLAQQIEQYTSAEMTEEEMQALREYAVLNTWAARAETMLGLIGA